MVSRIALGASMVCGLLLLPGCQVTHAVVDLGSYWQTISVPTAVWACPDGSIVARVFLSPEGYDTTGYWSTPAWAWWSAQDLQPPPGFLWGVAASQPATGPAAPRLWELKCTRITRHLAGQTGVEGPAWMDEAVPIAGAVRLKDIARDSSFRYEFDYEVDHVRYRFYLEDGYHKDFHWWHYVATPVLIVPAVIIDTVAFPVEPAFSGP